MKLKKVYLNKILLLVVFLCLKFCNNTSLSDSNTKESPNKNKPKLESVTENSQSIDDYIEELLKDENEQENENYFLEKTTSETINNNENFNKIKATNSTNKNETNKNSANKNKTTKDKKQFFNYKKNKSAAEAHKGTFRTQEGKWNVVALIKATDSMLEVFININPRLKSKKGKLWLAMILIKQYEECDKDFDSKLDLSEFKNCVDKQKYFGVLSDVPRKHAAQVFTREQKLQNIYGVSSIDQFSNRAKNVTNSKAAKGVDKTKADSKSNKNKNTNYLELIFNILNDSKNKYFSIQEYIKLRFLMLVYRKCNAVSFLLSKSNFVCIANEFNPEGQSKTPTTLSRIYNQIQSFSRFESFNDLDTINALSAFLSIDLFGKINKRHIDHIVSKAAFLAALGANELPQRYNAKNIEHLFSQLAHEKGEPAAEIDLHSFVFVDRFLRIFHDNSKKFKLMNINENYVDLNGFLNCFKSYLYPAKYLGLFKVHLKQYDVRNITKFEPNQELDFIPLNLKENVEADKLILLQKNLELTVVKEEENNKKDNNLKPSLKNQYTINNSNYNNDEINSLNFNFKEKAESELESENTLGQSTTTITKKVIRRVIKRKNSSSSQSTSSSSSSAAKTKKITINKSSSAADGGLSRSQQKAETSNSFFNKNIDVLLPKDYNIYLEKFFDVLYRKINGRDLVRFDDFLYLMQFMYLYTKSELKFNLFKEKSKLDYFFSLYSDFPLISPRFYNRFTHFRSIKENTVMDFYMGFLFFNYEDLISMVKIPSARTAGELSMAEIQRLLERVHILNMPEFLFKKCYTNKENRVIKVESLFNVNCVFNLAFEYVGQNINNELLFYHFKHNTLMVNK